MPQKEIPHMPAWPLVVVGLSLSVAGYFIGDGLYKAKRENRLVTVKGLAEKVVKSNIAELQITIEANGDDLSQMKQKIVADTEKLESYLASMGLRSETLMVEDYRLTDRYANRYGDKKNIPLRYQISKQFRLSTSNTEAAQQASQNVERLSLEGLNAGLLVNYQYSLLNDIKPEMVAMATRNARKAAQEFADDSGSEVGNIRRANQGVFQILSSNAFSHRGTIGEMLQKVRVVTTITYELAD